MGLAVSCLDCFHWDQRHEAFSSTWNKLACWPLENILAKSHVYRKAGTFFKAPSLSCRNKFMLKMFVMEKHSSLFQLGHDDKKVLQL